MISESCLNNSGCKFVILHFLTPPRVTASGLGTKGTATRREF